PELLTAFESCPRHGYYASHWEPHRLRPIEMVRRAVITGLTTDRSDVGEVAGEDVVDLAYRRGVEIDGVDIYRGVSHHAALSDFVVSAIRKPGEPAWQSISPNNGWTSSVFIDASGLHLRRFLPVAYWNSDRAQYERQSWFGLGEVAQYRLPMQLVVAGIGAISGGEGRRGSGLGEELL